MSKLAVAADALTWFLTLALPCLLVLHALAIAAYAALTRDWDAVRPLLPRNALIMAGLALLWLVMMPVHTRANHWRFAVSYGVARQIETQLDNGQYMPALRTREAMKQDTPARREVDARIDKLAPKVLSQGIAMANQGDYLGAMTLVAALPPDGSEGKNRARVLALWAPYAERQRRREALLSKQVARAFAAAAKVPVGAYDRLARETMPKALQLDPTAATRVDGRTVHPLAPTLMAASVQAGEISGEAQELVAKGPADVAARAELEAAADSFKRGCEESLAYANSADDAPAERAKKAFAEARLHRANLAHMLGQPAAAQATASAPASPAASPDESPEPFGEG